ncbi:MAG: Gfo/Idh/MocA family oxidoreductase [Candidatus Omnitrophota bacterium]
MVAIESKKEKISKDTKESKHTYKISPEPEKRGKGDTMKHIAVVGCGYWGKNLVRNFYELNSLYAICDSSEKRLEELKKKYPGTKTFASYEELLEDKEVSGVVLATPAVFHYTMAKAAMRSGKDVFVEKPLSLKVEEGEDLVKMADQLKRILMVGHILQYHSAVARLKELIDKGEMGKIQYIYSNRLNMGKIRTEENILWSFAPHDISVILELLSEEPISVSSKGGNYLQKAISDITLTNLDFPSGTKAHIFVSWLHPVKDQKLVVIGDKKMAVFDDQTKEKLFLYPHSINWINRVPVVNKAEAEVVPLDLEEPLKVECQHFLDCIVTRVTPVTDGREGLRVLKILNASQESLDNEGKKVSLKEKEKPYFLHESSWVDDGAQIGDGTKIWNVSHVLKNTKVGKNCKIGQNVVIGPNATVGDNCKIQNNVSVYDGIVLEDDVFCGPSMVFTNVMNPRSAVPRMHERKSTLVRKGATIGANATIICGNTIGKYAFIGAGAVVTKDIPDYALVVGNPSKIIGWMCECGIKLEFEKLNGSGEVSASCKECNKTYMKDRGLVRRMVAKEAPAATSNVI